jgi:DHA2 family multidrug resistance protein
VSEPATIAISPSRRLLLLVPLLLSTTLGMINQTNVVVALPHMQGSFSATREQIAWVLTSYLVTVTILTASTGWIGARFGRKQVYMAGLAGFGITSALCANAPSLETEVLFRLLQGVAAGPIFPVTQSILLDVYPKDRHGEALGLWGISITIGPVLGPILGGVITEEYGWPWIFYFNVPLSALCLFLVALWVPQTAKSPGRRFDGMGFMAMAVMITAFQLVLNRGQLLDWFDSTEIVVTTGAALFAFYVLAVHTATAKHSFLDRSLFLDRSFVLGLLFIVVWAMMVNGPIVLLSLRLQSLDGLPVDAVGYLMAPRGLGGVASMSIVGIMVRRFNPKGVAAFGFTLIAIAGWMMQSWPTHANRFDVALSGFILGFGISQAYVSLTVMAMATVTSAQRPDAVSLYSLVANIGMGSGVAIAVFMLGQSVQTRHEQLAVHVTKFNDAFRDQLLPHAWNFSSTRGLTAVDQQVIQQATTLAFNDTFFLITIVGVVALPFVFFLNRPARSRR